MKVESKLACFIGCDFDMGYVYKAANDLFISNCGELE